MEQDILIEAHLSVPEIRESLLKNYPENTGNDAKNCLSKKLPELLPREKSSVHPRRN